MQRFLHHFDIQMGWALRHGDMSKRLFVVAWLSSCEGYVWGYRPENRMRTSAQDCCVGLIHHTADC